MTTIWAYSCFRNVRAYQIKIYIGLLVFDLLFCIGISINAILAGICVILMFLKSISVYRRFENLGIGQRQQRLDDSVSSDDFKERHVSAVAGKLWEYSDRLTNTDIES